MDSEEFLMQFLEIENKLNNLVPIFDRKTNFINILEYLKSKNIFTSNLIKDLVELWEIRNKIISSKRENIIDKKIVEKLNFVKQNIN